GKIRIPLSGPALFLAGSATRIFDFWTQSRGIRFFSRKPRSSFKLRDGRSRAVANFARPLSHDDRIAFTRSLDPTPFSRRRVRGLDAVPLFQRSWRREIARGR